MDKTEKKYVLNVTRSSGRKTLHIKGGCYYSTRISETMEFNSVEELENTGMQFRKCRNCFKDRKG